MTGRTPDDRLMAAAAAQQLLAALGDEPPEVEVRRVDRAAEFNRLLRLGRAVDRCSREPGVSWVNGPDGHAVSSASVLLAELLDAGKAEG